MEAECPVLLCNEVLPPADGNKNIPLKCSQLWDGSPEAVLCLGYFKVLEINSNAPYTN